MRSDEPFESPPASFPPWPIIPIDDVPHVAFNVGDVETARELLSELERSLMSSLEFMRQGEIGKASGTIQIARSRLARWGGELAVLKERLER